MARRFFYDTEFMEEPGFLELISIGVVSEDGQRQLHRYNNDANLGRANKWVKENVLFRAPPKPRYPVQSTSWLSALQLRGVLMDFLEPTKEDPVELWGYFADYDHVVMCWLFGRMVDLPEGMPMWTRDLKQLMWHLGATREEFGEPMIEHDALSDALWNLEVFRQLKARAKQRGIVI